MKQAMKELAALLHQTDSSASFSFEFWDGEIIGFGGAPKVKLRVKSLKAARSLFVEGFLGFGEAFMSGDLEVEGDLQEILRLGLITRFDERGYSLPQKLRFLPFALKTRNTSSRARSNIEYHYNRSDEFYALFLDETMAYSCAYFRGDEDSLEQAQRNKYDHIARKLMLQPGDSLIDVGCGWGGMLIHSAREYGIKGVGNTLSPNQYEYAKGKIGEFGLQERLDIQLRDYRELTGVYDKFVSIGMFEHVGKEYIPVYMAKVAGMLKKGGLGLLHTIAKDTASLTDAWLRRYIFPGGYLPSLDEIVREMGRAGLCILDVEGLRMHYAKTLDRWIANFENNADKVRKMYGENFVRMWRLYLNGSSAGFKYGETRLYQILFSNGLNNELPLGREYLYPDRDRYCSTPLLSRR
jgi:cyclopropane-fatty-acyl-phospholipid synthase